MAASCPLTAKGWLSTLLNRLYFIHETQCFINDHFSVNSYYTYFASHDINQAPEKRTIDKEGKKKKKKMAESQTIREDDILESPPEPAPVFEDPEEKINNGGCYCHF